METGNRAFACLINIGQRTERALAFLQKGGQKWASGMPISNTRLGLVGLIVVYTVEHGDDDVWPLVPLHWDDLLRFQPIPTPCGKIKVRY